MRNTIDDRTLARGELKAKCSILQMPNLECFFDTLETSASDLGLRSWQERSLRKCNWQELLTNLYPTPFIRPLSFHPTKLDPIFHMIASMRPEIRHRLRMRQQRFYSYTSAAPRRFKYSWFLAGWHCTCLLLNEVNRFDAYGITYPTLEQWAAEDQGNLRGTIHTPQSPNLTNSVPLESTFAGLVGAFVVDSLPDLDDCTRAVTTEHEWEFDLRSKHADDIWK
ncbi:hypothetical protein KCV06_g75, partial [Aureobasidium melanogenum]